MNFIDLCIKKKDREDELYYWIRGTGCGTKAKYEMETNDQAAFHMLQDLKPEEIEWVTFCILTNGMPKTKLRRYMKQKGISVPIKFIKKDEAWINDRNRLEDYYMVGLSQEKITYEMFDCSSC